MILTEEQINQLLALRTRFIMLNQKLVETKTTRSEAVVKEIESELAKCKSHFHTISSRCQVKPSPNKTELTQANVHEILKEIRVHLGNAEKALEIEMPSIDPSVLNTHTAAAAQERPSKAILTRTAVLLPEPQVHSNPLNLLKSETAQRDFDLACSPTP